MSIYQKNEYKKVKIPFGFNKELDRVLLSLFHTFFVAITGHGKTLGMKSLLLRFHELYPDWKILIIDSKDKRDYDDLKADIPICFVETTEPLDLKNLLEPIVGAKMMYYFDKIIEEAIFDTLGEIQRNIEKKITDADEGKLKMHRRELGKLRVLNHLLKKLVKLVERPEITNKLELQEGFNVMPVSLPKVPTNLKRAFQQLIVRSVVRKLMLIEYEKVLLVLDENHKWSPQRYSSIVKQPLSELISEGRGKNVFVWMADQALTKVDKEPLKNVKIWVVGQQLQEHEVEDAVTAVSDIADLKVNKRGIKSLRIGNWIIVDGMHRTVEHAYLQPYNVPDDVATQIVRGANPEVAEPYIFEFESKLRESIGDDLMYKPKFEEEKRLREEAEKKLKELREEKGKLKEDITALERRNKTQAKSIQQMDEKLKAFEQFERALIGPFMAVIEEHFEKIKAEIQASLPKLVKQHLKTLPTPTLDTPQRIDVKHTEFIYNISHNEEPVSINTKTVVGKILFCSVKDLSEKEFTEDDLSKAMLEYGWNVKHNTLAPTLGGLVKEGKLVKVPKTRPIRPIRYRLPSKIQINMPET